MNHAIARISYFAAVLWTLTGCSQGPAAIDVPAYDPDASATKALELYDVDKDGFVAGEELQGAPSLRAAIKNIDRNGDGKVDAEEIAERIRTWQKMHIGYMNFQCAATLDGTPLAGARITFDPEEFMLGAIQSASAELAATGMGMPKIPKEKRPTPDTPPGVQAGLYKVCVSRIVAGKETIPARYNAATTLGQEVSKDDPAISGHMVTFKLKSK